MRNMEALVTSLRGRIESSELEHVNIDIVDQINITALRKVLDSKETDRFVTVTTNLKRQISESLRKLSASIHLIDGNTLLNHCNIVKTLNKMKKSKVDQS